MQNGPRAWSRKKLPFVLFEVFSPCMCAILFFKMEIATNNFCFLLFLLLRVTPKAYGSSRLGVE